MTHTPADIALAEAKATVAAAREAASETPETRVLAAELDELAARIVSIDAQLAEMEPERQAKFAAVDELERHLQALMAELQPARLARQRVLGRYDSLQYKRRGLLGQRSVKAEQLARLRERGPLPIVHWAGGR